MAGETIELLKGYTPDKMPWPAMHQQKFDGVPTRIIRVSKNEYRAVTRQGETLRSIQHIVEQVENLNMAVGGSIVGELDIEGAAFKLISGKVRQQMPYTSLILRVFDFDIDANPKMKYLDRRDEFQQRWYDYTGDEPYENFYVRVIPGVICSNEAAADEAHAQLMQADPSAEGSVLHDLNKPFQPGKRCWGTQRMKPVPTIDLRVMSFEEAMSDGTGKGLGMVGRLNAEFTVLKNHKPVTTEIGIGPGALTHIQRKALWFQQKIGKWKPTIAEIRYMRDETYEALRQPTFKRWRTDKQVADLYNLST